MSHWLCDISNGTDFIGSAINGDGVVDLIIGAPGFGEIDGNREGARARFSHFQQEPPFIQSLRTIHRNQYSYL